MKMKRNMASEEDVVEDVVDNLFLSILKSLTALCIMFVV